MISLDTETTGTDLHHAAKPFLVTTCHEESMETPLFWEWRVNPLTREPIIPERDIEEILELIETTDKVVMQNSKFDVTALLKIFPEGYEWPWHKTEDTLVLGHLLASNHPHDLTSMTLEYLGVDVSQYEERMKKVVHTCRNLVRRKNSTIHGWMIAEAGLPGMPSAKGSTWKYDLWLPREVAKRKVDGYDKEWLTITSQYANSDSTCTLALFIEQWNILQERKLEKIYRDSMEIPPILQKMETDGVTFSGDRLKELMDSYKEDSEKFGSRCLRIAKSFSYDLSLPKSGNNKSQTEFILNKLKVPVVKRSKKTGQPSLDRGALEHYRETLPQGKRAQRFITNLLDKRSRDTAIGYLESYLRFGIGMRSGSGNWYTLHPSLNMTGTDTLRFSSSNPNEQNISKKEIGDTGKNTRYVFGPAPGKEWWSMDAQNIELRIPAYEAREEEMIALFEKPNEPPYFGSNHLLVFDTLHPDKWDQSDPEGLLKAKKQYASTWYQYTKNGNFAVQYGAVEESGTADRAYHVKGAQHLIQKRFRRIKELNDSYIQKAEKYGYVETLPDITVDPIRGYPLLCTRYEYGRIKPTVPLNYHIQSTAMWWMRRAMVKTAKYLGDYGTLVMQIHDEIVIELPFKRNKGNLKFVQGLKEELDMIGFDFIPKIPITVGMEYHPNNWAESE